jgi:hypothetical protein
MLKGPTASILSQLFSQRCVAAALLILSDVDVMRFIRNSFCPLCKLIVVIVMVGAVASRPAAAARPVPGTIGINLNSLSSSGEEIPFVDVFKMSSPWTVHSEYSPAKQGPATLDANGWVSHLEAGEYAETMIFTWSDGHYPGGEYTLTYEGKGTLNVSGAGVTVVESSPGRVLLQVQPSAGGPGNGIHIRESGLDSAAPIKNIHLFLPGFAAEPKGNPFNPAFLAVLKPFKVIRFAGWSHVNRSETSTWMDERPVTFATQASPAGAAQKLSGVSLEYQIQLANLLHADPWFLVPLKADDDFLRRMAKLVHDRLDPSVRVYVELSNEVWNVGSFPEGAYARDMGQKLGLDSDPVRAGAKWYAGQAVHVFDLWSDVFGADSSRIVRVLGGTFSVPPINAVELSYQETYKHIDVLAVGLYVMPNFPTDYNSLSRMAPDDILDTVQSEVTGKIRDFSGYHLAITKKYGVDLVAYEGGPLLWATHVPPEALPHIIQTMREATESPRMATIYRSLLDQWFNLGGTLFNHFDDCSAPEAYGDLGLVDYQSQELKTSGVFQMFGGYIASHRGAMMHVGATPTEGDHKR